MRNKFKHAAFALLGLFLLTGFAAVHGINVNGALVYWEDHQGRWLDAIGNKVIKHVTDYSHLPTDDTTGDPTEYTMTVTEAGASDSTAVLDTTRGGNLKIQTDANENDGVSLQLKGEAFELDSSAETYYGTRLKVTDATQTDFIVGLAVTDTDLLGGMTDGAYFKKVDGSTSVSAITEKDSTETETTGVLTMDTSYHTLEIRSTGTKVEFFVDGSSVASHTTNIPDNEVLTPSFEFLTGEANSNDMVVDWMRAISVRQ